MFPDNSEGIILHILLQTGVLISGIIVRIVWDAMNQLWKFSFISFPHFKTEFTVFWYLWKNILESESLISTSLQEAKFRDCLLSFCAFNTLKSVMHDVMILRRCSLSITLMKSLVWFGHAISLSWCLSKTRTGQHSILNTQHWSNIIFFYLQISSLATCCFFHYIIWFVVKVMLSTCFAFYERSLIICLFSGTN